MVHTRALDTDVGGNFNDDPLWLILSTTAYIKETGDFDILDETVPFGNDESRNGSLAEHLRANPGDREQALADLSRVEETLRRELDPNAENRQTALEALATQLQALAGDESARFRSFGTRFATVSTQ